MKRLLVLAAVSVICCSINAAHAANHHHMRQLAKAGCTQVQEAEGTCPALQSHARVPVKMVRVKHALVDGIELRCDMPLPVDVTNAGRKWVDHNCD